MRVIPGFLKLLASHQDAKRQRIFFRDVSRRDAETQRMLFRDISRRDAKRQRMLSCIFLIFSFFVFTPNAHAALNENCSLSALNRTAQVKPDGSWSIPNVPSNTGPVRMRVTCIENGITTSGQSGWINVTTDGVVMKFSYVSQKNFAS